MGKIEDILKEANEYTSFCKLLDYQSAKTQEYIDKAAVSVEAAANLVIAAFPYGVGPSVIAAQLAANQALSTVTDAVESTITSAAIAAKLDTLEEPEGGCS